MDTPVVGLIGGITRGDGGRRGDNMRLDMTSAHIWGRVRGRFSSGTSTVVSQFPSVFWRCPKTAIPPSRRNSGALAEEEDGICASQKQPSARA